MVLALSGDSADALQYLGPLAISSNATPKVRADYALALVGAGRQDEAWHVLAVDLPPDKLRAALHSYEALLFYQTKPDHKADRATQAVRPPTDDAPNVQLTNEATF